MNRTPPRFSTAGFYEHQGHNRRVYSFNPGWRFLKGHAEPQGAMGPEQPGYDDSGWLGVNAPHGLELLPESASGSINYQGPAWYRKRFTLDTAEKDRRIILYFEGVMGKTKVWLNGKLVKEYFGGYLPIIIDISDRADFEGENVIALLTDNSNDHAYPPGKPQEHLDFCYFGGLYRDVWLYTTGKAYITDANEEDITAGGGVFLRYELDGPDALARAEVHLRNRRSAPLSGTVRLTYRDKSGSEYAWAAQKIALKPGEEASAALELKLKDPRFWSPEDPNLYDLLISLEDEDGTVQDGYRLRTGVRTYEFRRRHDPRGAGFFLNGKKYEGKLMGGNRHQEFALIGNALPNSLHWRDAFKMRRAGMKVIRCAHYPQDPSFMDACDELGLFVITATPGWQIWNWEPIFQERILSDIRHMIRRDRNRPSAFIWEPILNETRYPASFAKIAHETTHQEYPYPGCYTASDDHAEGQEHFDIVYSHPFIRFFWKKYWENTPENLAEIGYRYDEDDRCVFTREWGDSVDNFELDHNSPSRMAKSWGEQAQLVQALHYDETPCVASTWETLYDTPDQHIGGTLWHTFDHNRGYHPDPFWGGILDAWRLPKYSYYQFMAQNDQADPFVFMANELSPCSPADIVVFSNCEEVNLYRGEDLLGTKSTRGASRPSKPAIFKGAWNFYTQRADTRPFVLEGLSGGQVLTREEVYPAGRREEIVLEADLCGLPMRADGSDMAVVTARFKDRRGKTKRLTEERVLFSVTGPGEIVDDGRCGTNPAKLQWGEAAILVRAFDEPGEIVITCQAENAGLNTPLPAKLVIKTASADVPAIGNSDPTPFAQWPETPRKEKKAKWNKNASLAEEMRKKYSEIGKQQDDFA